MLKYNISYILCIFTHTEFNMIIFFYFMVSYDLVWFFKYSIKNINIKGKKKKLLEQTAIGSKWSDCFGGRVRGEGQTKLQFTYNL